MISLTLLLFLASVLGAIKSVAVSPNSRYIASGAFDKTARVWRTASAECYHVLTGLWIFFNTEYLYLFVLTDSYIKKKQNQDISGTDFYYYTFLP